MGVAQAKNGRLNHQKRSTWLSPTLPKKPCLTSFLKELGCADLANIVIYNDNCSAGQLAEGPVFHSRSKHRDIKHHFIRQTIKECTLKLVYLFTEEMIVDILTKALSGVKHSKCVTGLGLQSSKCSRAQFEERCYRLSNSRPNFIY